MINDTNNSNDNGYSDVREKLCSSEKWKYFTLCDKYKSLELYNFLQNSYKLLQSLEKKEVLKQEEVPCVCLVDLLEHEALREMVDKYIRNDVEDQVNLRDSTSKKTLIALAGQEKCPRLGELLPALRTIITEVEQLLSDNMRGWLEEDERVEVSADDSSSGDAPTNNSPANSTPTNGAQTNNPPANNVPENINRCCIIL